MRPPNERSCPRLNTGKAAIWIIERKFRISRHDDENDRCYGSNRCGRLNDFFRPIAAFIRTSSSAAISLPPQSIASSELKPSGAGRRSPASPFTHDVATKCAMTHKPFNNLTAPVALLRDRATVASDGLKKRSLEDQQQYRGRSHEQDRGMER